MITITVALHLASALVLKSCLATGVCVCDVVPCMRVQDTNSVSCSCVFVTSWISSLHPETSRWSEERDRRGREARRRLSRPLARRRKVQCEDKNSCMGLIDKQRTADGLCVCFCVVVVVFCACLLFAQRTKETNPCT